MAGKVWRGLFWCLLAVALTVGATGCALDALLAPPAPSPPAAGAGQPGAASLNEGLVGMEIFHAFSSQENQVDFTVIPSTAGTYIDGNGRVGPIDTSPTDPRIKSLNVVCHNFSPNDVVNVTLYDPQGAVAGNLPIKATGTIDVSTYNAASCRLTATTTDTAAVAPVPFAYLYQMTNSAGTTFTYTVPSPP